MGGMVLVYGHHAGVKSLAFYVLGETYQPLDIMLGRSRLVIIVYFFYGKLVKI